LVAEIDGKSYFDNKNPNLSASNYGDEVYPINENLFQNEYLLDTETKVEFIYQVYRIVISIDISSSLYTVKSVLTNESPTVPWDGVSPCIARLMRNLLVPVGILEGKLKVHF
jgi:hypothetical protein